MDFRIKTRFICRMLATLNHTISQKVAEIFDLYTGLHGTRISLFGPDKQLLYPDRTGRPNCTYCRLLRDELGLDAECCELDQAMMEAAWQQRALISYTCHAGMREAVAPLIVNQEPAGFVMIGQFRSQAAPDLSPYEELWRQTKGSDALQNAFAESTVLPEEKIGLLLAMFRQMLELILTGQLIHRKEYDLIGPVIARIQERPAEPLSLEQAARTSGRSPSTVTRLFKKVTGRSFKQYQTEARIRFAAERLLACPGRPVAEIAAEAGFEDPFYFSRLFHKQTGVSPRTYRSQQSKEVL